MPTFNSPTLAAIGALFKYRVADAGNSSVAALGPAGVFTGAWMRTDGYSRVDIALTLAATGTLAVQHSDDGVNPIAALTETWAAAAAAHPSFPTELRATWYRVVLTDTGGGGAVTLAATLDPRQLNTAALLGPVVNGNLAALAVVDIPLPLGARHACALNFDTVLGWPTVTEQCHGHWRTAAAALGGYVYGWGGILEIPPTATVLRLENNNVPGGVDYRVMFHP